MDTRDEDQTTRPHQKPRLSALEFTEQRVLAAAALKLAAPGEPVHLTETELELLREVQAHGV